MKLKKFNFLSQHRTERPTIAPTTKITKYTRREKSHRMKTFSNLQEGVNDPNIFKAFFLAGGQAVVSPTLLGKPLVVLE